MNLIIWSNRMSIFPNNYHNKNNAVEISETFSINSYKTDHRIDRMQQFYKILCAITFKDR